MVEFIDVLPKFYPRDVVTYLNTEYVVVDNLDHDSTYIFVVCLETGREYALGRRVVKLFKEDESQ